MDYHKISLSLRIGPKTLSVGFVLALSSVLPACPQSGNSKGSTLEVGMMAPKLECKSLGGKKIAANFLKNRVVLVDYWATWCSPCIEMMPLIDGISRKYKGNGFAVLSISIDEDSKALSRFVSGHRSTEPVFHDKSKGFKRWGVTVLPTVFLLKNGVVKGIFYFSDRAKIDRAVRAELAKA